MTKPRVPLYEYGADNPMVPQGEVGYFADILVIYKYKKAVITSWADEDAEGTLQDIAFWGFVPVDAWNAHLSESIEALKELDA